MSKIIAQTIDEAGQRFDLVETRRGARLLVNVDQVVLAAAEAHSELLHEQDMGWQLELPWYKAQLERVMKAVTPYPAPRRSST